MSNSLVHKSLELLGYEKDLQKKLKRKKKRKDIRYKGVLDLIPTKHILKYSNIQIIFRAYYLSIIIQS